jgi:hypothetical protein
MPQTERTPWALLNDIGKLWRRRADLVALPVVISPPIPRPQLKGRLCLRLPEAQLQQLESVAMQHGVPHAKPPAICSPRPSRH